MTVVCIKNTPAHNNRQSIAHIMGIVNITPDSFSDGGLYHNTDAALKQAELLINEGSDIIDIGGESSRPGAQSVTVAEEIKRVIPVIKQLRQHSNIAISIDTYKPQIMRQAVAAGATMINDIYALQTKDALATAADLAVDVCLMHMQGTPQTMQDNPHYDDVVMDVTHFFEQRIEACLAHNISTERLVIDPGFGFGKTLAHNIALFQQLDTFKRFGVRLLVGTSRKSMLAKILSAHNAIDNLAANITAAVLAVQKGADYVRVHDVKATKDALDITNALQ